MDNDKNRERKMQSKVLPIILSILLLTQSSFAAPVTPVSPKTPKPAAIVCQPLKLKSQNKNITLESNVSSVSQIFLIQNQSQKSIWLDHPVKHPSASAGWSSYFRPGEWSALLLSKKDFALS